MKVVLLLSALATLLVAGCSGGDGKKAPVADNGATTTATRVSTPTARPGEPGESTATGNGTPLAVESVPVGASPGAFDQDELDEVIDAFQSAKFHATYAFTAAPGDSLGSGTLAWFRDGSERQRYDVVASQDGDTTEISLIQAPDASGVCFKNAGELAPILGVGPDDGVCLDDNPDDSGGLGDLSDPIDAMADQEPVSKTARTIAGVAATCYQTRDGDGGVTDACFGDDGQVLSLQASDGSVYEATSIDGSVKDDDFKLPYAVKQAPSPGD